MVKCHATAIKKHMDNLAQLARSDEKIAEGVAAFFGECFLNVTWMLCDSARRLPLRPDSSPYFRIQIMEEEEAPALETRGEFKGKSRAITS